MDQRWRSSSTEHDRYQYGYDRDSNRTYRDNLVNTAFGELYAYDDLNQIVDFQRGTLNSTKTAISGTASRTQSWDFDALGNFDSQTTDSVTQTRSHNKQNEITSVSGASSPTFDSNGNMLTDETGKQFVFDAWNRLKIVKDSSGNTLKTYAYDALTHRISETAGSNTTDLYYSAGWQVLEERVNGSGKYRYVWSPVYVDAMILRDRLDASERLWVQQDANFNVTALVDNSGSVVERFVYDPFGKASVLSSSWGTLSSSGFVWTVLFQGLMWDAATGLYGSSRYRGSGYSPTLGRWMTPDPLGLGPDINFYRFVENSPIVLSDPLGLDPPNRPGSEGEPRNNMYKKYTPDGMQRRNPPPTNGIIPTKPWEGSLDTIRIDKSWKAADVMKLFERITACCPGAKESQELFRQFLDMVRNFDLGFVLKDKCWKWAQGIRGEYLKLPGKFKLPDNGYFALKGEKNWINYNNGIEHQALVIEIRGCKGEKFVFMLDDALGGGIGNEDHIFGDADVGSHRLPFDGKNPPNWWLPDFGEFLWYDIAPHLYVPIR